MQEQAELEDENELSQERRFGNQFHLSVSTINTPEEIDIKLNDLHIRGEIEDNFYDGIKEELTNLFLSKEYSQILEGATTVLNEQEIIVDEKTTIRPDKIVFKKNEVAILDFKTGLPNQKHKSQLHSYIHAIQEMGYKNVKGHIYYTLRKEFVELNG